MIFSIIPQKGKNKTNQNKKTKQDKKQLQQQQSSFEMKFSLAMNVWSGGGSNLNFIQGVKNAKLKKNKNSFVLAFCRGWINF